LWIGRKNAVDRDRVGVYIPASSQKGPVFKPGTDAADSRLKGHCPRMFDIVIGRETRAAVLLAGFAFGFGQERPQRRSTVCVFLWKASSMYLPA
jgi:hypothetical protein